MTDSSRYARQSVLPEIGADGQARLLASRVLIVGVGGLGSPVALYLAAAGIGEIGLVDPDRVEVSNLQRQILFQSGQQGRLKVEAAQESLRALNPAPRIHLHPERLSPENACAILQNYDLIIDGTDNFPSKFLIADAARSLGLPLVHGAVTGFEGRVAVFAGKEGPCFRCLFPELPKQQITNCAEAGVLGSVAGTIGSLQALEATKWLLGNKTSIGRMLVLDAWNLAPRIFEFAQIKNCSFCFGAFDPERHEYNPLNKGLCMKLPLEVTPEDLKKVSGYTMVDIREPSEWNEGHIAGAVHWPIMKILSGNQEFDANHHYVLYCRSGARSAAALEHLQNQGIRNVSHLRGGILSWRAPLKKD